MSPRLFSEFLQEDDEEQPDLHVLREREGETMRAAAGEGRVSSLPGVSLETMPRNQHVARR